MKLFGRTWCKSWRPTAYYESIQHIPLAEYYAAGVRLALLDIDNTLMPHGHSSGQRTAQEALLRIKATGLTPVILSNAKRERARSVARDLGAPVIGMAMKPSPRGIEEAMKLSGFKETQTILIGDQIFTDIWAGRRAGIPSILVRPISLAGEPIQIVIKRFFERWLFRTFECEPTYDDFL
ncbi:MAG TPA: YqeG family HAD IIIA-type phosphatase [Clostridiaceae bacterium]|nr:YqeG family HAD IIIA-type phosphatase [Clostridiaceae bacterium]